MSVLPGTPRFVARCGQLLSLLIMAGAVRVASQQATALAGSFNLPAKESGADIALTGRPGWKTIPLAFSRGNGTFSVTNRDVGAFAGWSAQKHVTRLSGDFNADGKTDIALIGGSGWDSVPGGIFQRRGHVSRHQREVVADTCRGSAHGGGHHSARGRLER